MHNFDGGNNRIGILLGQFSDESDAPDDDHRGLFRLRFVVEGEGAKPVVSSHNHVGARNKLVTEDIANAS